MIFRVAHQNDVQVVATTHSSDCITAFASAAMDNQGIGGELVRLNSHDGELYADTYSAERVANAARHSIELR